MSISLSRIPEFEGAADILSDEALAFIEKLHQKFAGTRDELLAARSTPQAVLRCQAHRL